ncbi:hypothetical protein WR25_22567 [Diploscapter pachys]|uniref:Uncharacterized protein n=1 Tax=Diploscapter pachys TaxID=2018661 RepID=A0A2A2K4V7_9BILA|nr:hypothetical protein WR25_22567 [Diploscapter pachys]
MLPGRLDRPAPVDPHADRGIGVEQHARSEAGAGLVDFVPAPGLGTVQAGQEGVGQIAIAVVDRHADADLRIDAALEGMLPPFRTEAGEARLARGADLHLRRQPGWTSVVPSSSMPSYTCPGGSVGKVSWLPNGWKFAPCRSTPTATSGACVTKSCAIAGVGPSSIVAPNRRINPVFMTCIPFHGCRPAGLIRV